MFIPGHERYTEMTPEELRAFGGKVYHQLTTKL